MNWMHSQLQMNSPKEKDHTVSINDTKRYRRMLEMVEEDIVYFIIQKYLMIHDTYCIS